jgi:hypothetical protein
VDSLAIDFARNDADTRHMTLNSAHPGPRWDHLGKRLQLARAPMSRADAARKSGIPYSTLKEFEKGPWPSAQRTEPTPTMRAYAEFLGWTADSVDTVLAGGEPTKATTPADAYVAIAAGASAEEQLRILRDIQGSNMPEGTKAWLQKVLLG